RFGAAGGHDDIDHFRAAVAQHVEVQADVVQRIGNELPGLDLDLALQVVVAQPAWQRQYLGDDGRPGDRGGSVLELAAGTFQHALHGVAHRIDIADELVADRVRWERFDRPRFDSIV